MARTVKAVLKTCSHKKGGKIKTKKIHKEENKKERKRGKRRCYNTSQEDVFWFRSSAFSDFTLLLTIL